jgi:uncharacterized protein YbaR (Trm112 family)
MQRVSVASAELVAQLNRERRPDRSGRVESLDGGLIREDGRLLFPIRDGLPILLLDEAIPIDDRPAASSRDSTCD